MYWAIKIVLAKVSSMWKTKERVYYGICKERQGPQLDRMNIIEILNKIQAEGIYII